MYQIFSNVYTYSIILGNLLGFHRKIHPFPGKIALGHSADVRTRKAPNSGGRKHRFHSLLVKISNPLRSLLLQSLNVGAKQPICLLQLLLFAIFVSLRSLTKN